MPEFEEAAFNAPLNKVVRCKTQFGWHLLQVVSERYVPKIYILSNMLASVGSHLVCTYSFYIAPYPVREESLLQDIQPDKLHAKMQDPNFSEEAQLVDVREPEEVYAHF